jgi:hypothetical protein
MVGVGITPPKVLGTPKPASSVMISSTLGASLGGTTRGAHQGLDCRAPSLMTPPNFGSGAGSCLLLTVVVALGLPGTPIVCCCARARPLPRPAAAPPASRPVCVDFLFMNPFLRLTPETGIGDEVERLHQAPQFSTEQ